MNTNLLPILALAGLWLGQATTGFRPGDQLLVYDNTVAQLNKSAARIYTYVHGAWRRSGSTVNAGSDEVFTPGTGVILRKATTAAGATSLWVNPSPYTY